MNNRISARKYGFGHLQWESARRRNSQIRHYGQMNPAPAAPEPAPPGGWPEHLATPAGKPRARSLGIPFGGTPGRWNAITDVPGVQVGYTTLIEGDSVRTGVTAIHPRGPDGAADPVAAGFFSQNGNGEMTGIVLDRGVGHASPGRSPSPTPTRSGSRTPRSSPGRPGTTPTSPTPGSCRWPRRPGTATSTTSTGTTSPSRRRSARWSRAASRAGGGRARSAAAPA